MGLLAGLIGPLPFPASFPPGKGEDGMVVATRASGAWARYAWRSNRADNYISEVRWCRGHDRVNPDYLAWTAQETAPQYCSIAVLQYSVRAVTNLSALHGHALRAGKPSGPQAEPAQETRKSSGDRGTGRGSRRSPGPSPHAPGILSPRKITVEGARCHSRHHQEDGAESRS